MKRIFVGIFALTSTLATSATAADMPVKAPIIPPVAVYDWTGFYAGLNVGYSWGRSSTYDTFYDSGTGTILSAATAKFNMNGAIGGGQVGYNWEWNRWVFGLEADIQGSGQKGSALFNCLGGTPTLLTTAAAVNGVCTQGHFGDTAPFNVLGFPVAESVSENLKWFGTVRGRIGPTITPTVLVYATGGLAYGEVDTNGFVYSANVLGPQGVNGGTSIVPVTTTFGSASTRVGWTVGAGIEGVVTGNWTVKAEYLYIDLGTVSGNSLTPVVAPSGALLGTTYSSHITDNIVRVGFNYKFAGPVVAKY
jgi:outer membrane immunogenic protein